MARKRSSKGLQTQRDVIAVKTHERFKEAVVRAKLAMKIFGLSPSDVYSITITSLLKLAFEQFLEVHHLQGNDLGISKVDANRAILEDLAHDVGSFVCTMLEAKDKNSRYVVQFVRKDKY